MDDCFCCRDASLRNEYRLIPNDTLVSDRDRIYKDARDDCCFCLLFTGAAIGTGVVATATHGASMPAQVSGLVVSSASAAMCLKRCFRHWASIKAINNELEQRRQANVRYIDNYSNVSFYSTRTDDLQRMHYPSM